MEQLTGTMSSVPNSNNYENMSHKPQINGVELTGNKTSEELGLGGGEVTRSVCHCVFCNLPLFLPDASAPGT